MACKSILGFIVLLFASLAHGQSSVSTIKPLGGGDYASLSNWWAAKASEAAPWAECYTGGDLGVVDMTGAGYSGSYSATNYIRIYTPLSERHTGTTNAGAFAVGNSSGYAAIRVGSKNWIHIEGLRVILDNFAEGLYAAGCANVYVDGNLFYSTNTTHTGWAHAEIRHNATGVATNTVINNIVYGKALAGIHLYTPATSHNSTKTMVTYCFNNTVVGARYGIKVWEDKSIYTNVTPYIDGFLRNNIAVGCDTNFWAHSTVTNYMLGNLTNGGCGFNLSSDSSANDLGGVSNLVTKNATNQFIVVTNNWNLSSGSDAINVGTNVSALFDWDVRHTNTWRPQGLVWDMGALEMPLLAYWIGASNTVFTNAANWTNELGESTVPNQIVGAYIQVNNITNPVLNLTNGSYTVDTLFITGTPTTASTLTLSNGNTSTRMLIVKGATTVCSSGVITHAINPATEQHALFLTVSNNLSIQNGGRISVSERGALITLGNGRPGGTHGGQGGYGYNTTTVGTPYGSITNPVISGSYGFFGSAVGIGGGVIRIIVSGSLTNNGDILANGQSWLTSNGGGGAGGSVYIEAGSIAGTGTVSAAGGAGYNISGSGGGGRIAIYTAGSTIGSIVTDAGSRGAQVSGQNGACGTVFLKRAGETYGSLVVNGKGIPQGNYSGYVPYTIMTNVTHQFDSILTTNYCSFMLSTNATLNMNGCVLRSDSVTNNLISILLLEDGGTLAWTGTWTNNGTISKLGTNQISVLGDLCVGSNGILTHVQGNNNNLNLSVSNLTINPAGVIWVNNCGYGFSSGPAGYTGAARAGGAHGGQGGTSFGGVCQTTYDSITNPVMAGGGAFYSTSYGGGVVLIKANVVTIDGIINAGSKEVSLGATGAGGTINIQAGQLLGSGTMSVNSGNHTSDRSSGGGGRIAVILTNDSTFGSVTMTAAPGTAGAGNAGAAGTIYLKGTNITYGRLIIPGTTDSQTTFIGALVTDAVVGDVVLQSGAKLQLTNTATLITYGSWSNAAATNAISGGTVEFRGATTNYIWGGNTWSNIVITNANKTMLFQAGVTQTVYGTPTFSNNVSLLSSSAGSWWYIRKPGAGNQYVGTVTVRDSNASGGLTFRMADGSTDVGNNVNWGFIVTAGGQVRMILIPQYDSTLNSRNVFWP